MMGARVGAYGKVASQADFLRVNAGAFARVGLDRWLAEGVQTVHAEKATLPPEPAGFVVCPPSSDVAFVGALAPAADAAGRAFVLAVFAEIASDGLAERLPNLPATYGYFVNAAGALAGAGGTLDGAAIAAGAQELEATLPDEAPGAGGGLADQTVSSLIEELGGGQAALAYACRTLAAACDQAASGRGGAITVDAPAASPAARQLWVEIARRRMGGQATAPALLWTDGTDGRLLMTLGAPSGSAFSYLANRRHRSNRLWPLRTEVASAVAEATSAMTAAQRAVVGDSRASLADVAAAFAS
jgi:type VI secretion system ImpM family protein